MNVMYLLPLPIAVLHNGAAALLLATIFLMRYLESGEAKNASTF
jgi:cytochrome c oxidase assembly protein subunit 15